VRALSALTTRNTRNQRPQSLEQAPHPFPFLDTVYCSAVTAGH